MRVIAGTARRLPLITPDGEHTRPTQDRIKETLFNMIQTEVPGAVFADLCAGGGGIGIEAISRGALRSYFVENDKNALKCLQENLHKTRFEDAAVLLRQDVLSALRHIHEKQLDIIYVDPPYQGGLSQRILENLADCSFVTENTLIIVETSLDTDFSFVEDIGMKITREKNYKSQRHLFIRREEEQS